MLIFRCKFLLVLLFQLLINCSLAGDKVTQKDNEVSNKKPNYNCSDNLDKKVLHGGWYLWEPYQFNKLTAGDITLLAWISNS